MDFVTPCMDMQLLEKTLTRMRTKEVEPPLFRDSVWREIRHRRALEGAGFPVTGPAQLLLLRLRSVFIPTFAAGLITALLVAWTVGSWWNRSDLEHSTVAIELLDLGVFGPQAQGLAHDKLVVLR